MDHIKSILLTLLLAAAFTTTNAVPTAEPSEAEAKCDRYTTYKSAFDDLAVGTQSPYSYGSVSWSQFTVVAGLENRVIPESGSNVMQGPTHGAYISQNRATLLYTLSSFSFACTTSSPSTPQYATPCVLQITALPYDSAYEIKTWREKFTPVTDRGGATKMQKVSLGKMASGFYFDIVGGPGLTQVFLDDLVIKQRNESCA